MKTKSRLLLAAYTLLVLIAGVVDAAPAFRPAETSANAVIEMEKRWWEAYKNHDVDWYRENVKSDAILVNPSGRHAKSDMVESATSGRCEVHSFTLGDFHTIVLAEGVVLLSYHATEDTTCDGQKSASKVYGTTIYTKESDRWLVAFAQETVIPE
jgi:ketosteroid isomerase-like protein